MVPLLAQIVIGGGIVQWLVVLIIVAAVVAIVYVALQAMGIGIPPWVARIFWIVIIAFVAILAIKLLVGLV